MAYFTPEQISKAKEIDLLNYLQNHNPDELVYDSRNTFHTRTHDSLKINNGMWYWFSRGIGGKTALEYLIQVENYSFTDAVAHLLNQTGHRKISTRVPLTEQEKKEKLILPKKDEVNDKVIKYLCGRGISKNIIEECINKDLVYQEYPRGNVVFVGYDEDNNPRYAGIRGTNSSRYMHDAYGSDKFYSFKLKANGKSKVVHLFEGAIDLLSYATLKEQDNQVWDNEHLLSLAGIYSPSRDIYNSKVPKTVERFLKNNPLVDTIILHFDNDKAGRLASKAITIALSDKYKIIDCPPKIGKDFNEFLCYTKGICCKDSSFNNEKFYCK